MFTANRLKSQDQSAYVHRTRLIGRMALMAFGVTAIYFVLALISGVEIDPYIFSAFVITSLGSWLLNKMGNPRMAKFGGLLLTNVLIFLVANSEPLETGIHFHFVTLGAIALILYGYEEWPGGVAFVALSVMLFITSYLTDFSFFESRQFSATQARIFFVMNVAITSAVCAYLIIASARISYESEKILQERERIANEQKELLEKTNTELDRFVYSVSHDLRAPLSSVTGLLQLASKHNVNTTELNHYHQLMKLSVQKLELFISNIIDFSRNARGELRQDQFKLSELISEVHSSLQFSQGAEAVELTLAFNPEFVIQSDRSRLQIILFNLISNAIQYRDTAKEKCNIIIRATVAGGHLQLEVADNGLGINPEHQERVFDMFFRANERSSGSGLGLYIVKETVLRLGGKLKLSSSPRVGSTFFLSLPVVETGLHEMSDTVRMVASES